MNRAEVRIACASSTEAHTLLAALAPDDGGHLRSRVEGEALVLDAEADTMMGLLRTLDDALACLRAAGTA